MTVPLRTDPAVVGRALTEAETALRALGLTGSQAFDALLRGLEFRFGAGARPEPAVARIAEQVPIGRGADLFGLAYERFFPDLFKGLRGQFFTPPPVAELLVSLVPGISGAAVLDPTCGSGGLLIAAARRGGRVRGIEIDPNLARLARLNLGLAQLDGTIVCADFFLTEPDPVDVVVANPPFSVPIRDRSRLDRYEMGRGRDRVPSDHLFVEALEGWVRPGGHAALVLPYSLVANRSTAGLRERIDAHWTKVAICALPEGVFRPFGGAAGRAVLLWLRRGAGRGATRWASIDDPGYDVRSKRLERTPGGQIEALARGERWEVLPDGAWTAGPGGHGTRPLSELVRAREVRLTSGQWVADLADVERGTGELVPRAEGVRGRIPLHAGDLLVSRLRPNLGNVARVPPGAGPLVGSPEWIALEPLLCGSYVLHALRTPTWRQALPLTDGQTRPRTSAEVVLSTKIVWPDGGLAARIDALSTRWFAERAALRDKLSRLQALVDRFAAAEIDEQTLGEQIAALEKR